MQSLGNGNNKVVPRDGADTLSDAGGLSERIRDQGELRSSSFMIGLSVVYANYLTSDWSEEWPTEPDKTFRRFFRKHTTPVADGRTAMTFVDPNEVDRVFLAEEFAGMAGDTSSGAVLDEPQPCERERDFDGWPLFAAIRGVSHIGMQGTRVC
jgi:hypothetical protein